MKEDKNIDQAIRDKLEQFSAEPPAHVWNGIQAEMGARRRKKRMLYFAWTAAAAVIVFAFIAGWMINKNPHDFEKTMVERSVKVDHGTRALAPSENETQILSLDEKDDQQVTVLKTNNLQEDAVLYSAAQVDGNMQDEVPVSENSSVRFSVQPLASRSRVVFQSSVPQLRGLRRDTSLQADALSATDRAVLAANLRRAQGKHQKKQKTWGLGAFVSPGYSAHQASYSAQYAQNLDQIADGGVGNIGGGFSLQFKSGKRLRLETGIYYAQNSQSDGSFNRLLAFAPSTDAADGSLTEMESDDRYASSIQLKNDGLAINSTAGTIKLRAAPNDAEINTLANEMGTAYNATLVADGELLQVFDFVEIPLYLRYRIVDRNIGIDVLGGLNAGLVVGNNAYLESESGKQLVGETENISTLNVSGTIGLGASYRLGKHVSLAIEPRLNYYLNSINSSSQLSYKPYRIALFTGLYYEF